jgi:hypothetical protein
MGSSNGILLVHEACLSDLQEQGMRKLLPVPGTKGISAENRPDKGVIMATCGNCRHSAIPANQPAPLFQIRRGYQARWNGLAVSVETDSSGWALHIQDSANRDLYTAHRAGQQAAQIAAAEYAIFRVLGPASAMSADRLARELNWQVY